MVCVFLLPWGICLGKNFITLPPALCSPCSLTFFPLSLLAALNPQAYSCKRTQWRLPPCPGSSRQDHPATPPGVAGAAPGRRGATAAGAGATGRAGATSRVDDFDTRPNQTHPGQLGLVELLSRVHSFLLRPPQKASF